MTPLRLETDDCTAAWVSLMVDHRCVLPGGHDGAHQCFCGANSGDGR